MPEEPITVDCQISSQKFDFDYELDNTLEMFLSDLQDQQPPMGFNPSKHQQDPTAGVFVNGKPHFFSANPQATLSSLGATTNSIIIVTDFVHVDGGPPPAPSGLKNKRARMTLTGKKARKPIVKRTHVGLVSVDIDALSDFAVVKLAALNGFNESLSDSGVQQRIEALKSWLRRLKSKGSVRTKVPDKFQDKSVETAIGELPFKNFVLWCTATDTLPDGALHTLLNAESLCEDSPSGDIVNLLGKPCQKPNCQGTIRLWDYASTPPK
jgi:hypothetical protein